MPPLHSTNGPPATEPPPPVAPAKVRRLHEIVDQLGSVAVAFSAGVDSTVLLKVAHDRLGERAVAAMGISPSVPPGEAEEARRLAREIGAELCELDTRELEDPEYTANPVDRCFFCKRELYRLVVPFARERGLQSVADGMNFDDLGDWRPGAEASDRAGVRHPLREAELTKAEVRRLGFDLGLSNWDKPALACLSSRVPHGTPIDAPLLERIGRAELVVRELGFREVRVRAHGDAARLEVPPADLARAFEQRAQLSERIREAGFAFAALDLDGYRTGSLNVHLPDGPLPGDAR